MLFQFCALLFFGVFAFVLVIFFRESNDSKSGTVFLNGVLTIPLGLLFAWGFSKTLKNKLVIYENGLIFSDGKDSETVLWDEIESVYEAIQEINSNGIKACNYFYAIKTKDYRELKFEPHLKNLQQFGERLKLVVLGGSFPTERICVIFQSNDGKAI